MSLRKKKIIIEFEKYGDYPKSINLKQVDGEQDVINAIKLLITAIKVSTDMSYEDILVSIGDAEYFKNNFRKRV